MSDVKNQEMLDLMQFNFECTKGFLATYEGSVHDYLYVESEHMKDYYFTFLFTEQEITEEIIDQYTQRMRSIDRTASFVVLADSDNEHRCAQLGLTRRDPTVCMVMDVQIATRPSAKTDDKITIETQSIPFSQDFLDVFRASYVGNDDGVGYTLGEESIDAFRHARAITELEERVFVLKYDGVPVSIAQSSSHVSDGISFLYNVATHPDFRQRGLSRALLNYLLEDVHSLGITKMYIETEEDSPMATFYESLGFSTIGMTRIYTNDVP